MMKRYKIVAFLLICLCIVSSVSCTKEEMQEMRDERLVGAWKLESIICHVKGSDNYLSTITEQKIIAEDLFSHYVFRDTVLFDEKGFFMESGDILREEVLESLFDFLPQYELKEKNQLVIDPYKYSSTWEGRKASYEIDQDLLKLEVELQPVFWYHIKDLLFYEGHDVRGFEIEDISYTQIYRKIKDFPYDRE